VERLILRAAALLAQKDVVGARLVLERAADLGNGIATFRLAETYDQAVLTTWGSRIRGDKAKAAEFYRRAASLGVACKRGSN
jgi:TPR repeat protein